MKTDRFYTFQVSLSKDAYKTKDETKAAVAERNTAGNQLRAELGLERQLSYRTIDCTSEQLLQYALDGYTFCTVHDGFPTNNKKGLYTYSDGYYSMKAKSSQFFTGAYFIGVDIDDTRYQSAQDFVDKLSLKPTFWYTSLSNQQIDSKTGLNKGARFRLIYVFDTLIEGKYFFRYCSWNLHQQIIYDTEEDIHDKCGLRCDQYFNGTNWNDSTLNIDYDLTNNVYSLDDIQVSNQGFYSFLDRYCEYKDVSRVKKEIDELKCVLFSHSKNIKQNTTTQLLSEREKNTHIELDTKLLNDAYRLNYDEFYNLYKHKYQYIYRREKDEWLIFHDDELGDVKYQECDSGYLELRWVSMRDRSGNVVNIPDGCHRRSTLFHRCWLRRLIKADATPDELFFNLMVDRERFFDNSDGCLDVNFLADKVKQSFEYTTDELIEKYANVYNDTIEHCCKKRFIIHWSSKKKIKPISLTKELRWQIIDQFYNNSLSVQENLKCLTEEGIEISKSSLYRYVKNRGIRIVNTKYELFCSLHVDGMSLRKELMYLASNGLKISDRTLRAYRQKRKEELESLELFHTISDDYDDEFQTDEHVNDGTQQLWNINAILPINNSWRWE